MIGQDHAAKFSLWTNKRPTFMAPKGGNKKRPAGAADSGSSTPHIPSLAEQHSYLHAPRPFKNPAYTKNINRRTKNLKTVLGQERERERVERERRREEGMDVDGEEGEEIPTCEYLSQAPYSN